MIRRAREAEATEGSRCSHGKVCRRTAIIAQTLIHRHQRFRGVGDDQIKRLRRLVEEKRRL